MKSDEGDYTCVVSNEFGIIRHTFKIEVLQYLQDKPLLVDKSSNLTLLEGMNARFYCKFKCDLTYSIAWARPAEDVRTGKIKELVSISVFERDLKYEFCFSSISRPHCSFRFDTPTVR